METGRRFFTAMYGQPEGTSMSLARYNLYTRKKGKPPRIMALPPTEANLLFHMKRVRVQVMLWKAADRQGSLPFVDITKFGWDMKSWLPSPSLDIYTGIYIYTSWIPGFARDPLSRSLSPSLSRPSLPSLLFVTAFYPPSLGLPGFAQDNCIPEILFKP